MQRSLNMNSELSGSTLTLNCHSVLNICMSRENRIKFLPNQTRPGLMPSGRQIWTTTATKLNEIKLRLQSRKLFINPINKLMARIVSMPILSMCQDRSCLTKRDIKVRYFSGFSSYLVSGFYQDKLFSDYLYSYT